MFFVQVNQRHYEHSHTVPHSIKDSLLIGHVHPPHLYDAPSHLVLPELRFSHPLDYIVLHSASSVLTSIGCAKLTRLRQPNICMQDAWEMWPKFCLCVHMFCSVCPCSSKDSLFHRTTVTDRCCCVEHWNDVCHTDVCDYECVGYKKKLTVTCTHGGF